MSRHWLCIAGPGNRAGGYLQRRQQTRCCQGSEYCSCIRSRGDLLQTGCQAENYEDILRQAISIVKHKLHTDSHELTTSYQDYRGVSVTYAA